MDIRYKQAREERRLSAVELANKLDVHPSTIANWESSRRQITPDKLVQMAEILGFSVDYLLGRDCAGITLTEPVVKEALLAMHGQPAWVKTHGWMLVNVHKNAFVLRDLSLIAFDEVNEPIYLIPPAFSLGLRGIGAPMGINDILGQERVWLEPITTDSELGAELRGWYRLQGTRFLENEFGNRFYLDTYGAKWLAFKSCVGGLQ